jgi:hypothetical protein
MFTQIKFKKCRDFMDTDSRFSDIAFAGTVVVKNKIALIARAGSFAKGCRNSDGQPFAPLRPQIPKAAANSSLKSRLLKLSSAFLSMGLLLASNLTSAGASAVPTLSTSFSPATIGPGSTATLTYTITAPGVTVLDLGFTNTLPTVPGPLVISTPGNAQTNCPDGTVTAPDGGGVVTFADARLAANQSCTVAVNVTAATSGVYTNSAVTLTSGLGSAMSLPVDLTVDYNLPGFSKSFAPSTVALGGRSTLTLTIDNTASEVDAPNLDFVDSLPVGMLVASPANASTTCGTAVIPATLTANPGSSSITLDANGGGPFPALASGASCEVVVDVRATAQGALNNVSGDLVVSDGNTVESVGKSTATQTVTGAELLITKDFLADPVVPGGAVILKFTVSNFNRGFQATSVAFTDDLAATLAGLTFTSLVSNDCGGTITGEGTASLGLTNGAIAPGATCTLQASLTVPAATTPGSYVNTTTAVTGMLDGLPVEGNMANDTLSVAPVPSITKEFIPNKVNAGAATAMRFTITNTSTTSAATDITFRDELTPALPFPLIIPGGLPALPCGAGSSLAFFLPATERQGFELIGGTLAASGMAGDSCTFDVPLEIPGGQATGVITNTTQPISATVDGATRTGGVASDDLEVVAAPDFSKSFKTTAVPGATVDLEFTITHSSNAVANATALTFTDNLGNLTPALAGLVPTGLPASDVCGAGSQLSGSTVLTLTGGTLTPGQSCTFKVTLNVPAGAAGGSYANTTSKLGATIGGVALEGQVATAELVVQGLQFSKSYLQSPVLPGTTVDLEFTIKNSHPTGAATAMGFTDNLLSAGLFSQDPPIVNTCNGDANILTIPATGSIIIYENGSLAAQTECKITFKIDVPATVAVGDYENFVTSLSAMQNGSAQSVGPAISTLEVRTTALALSKEFTDDPVIPGGFVKLKFKIENLTAESATGISFTDDLNSVLTGLTAVGFPAVGEACGGTLALEVTQTGVALKAPAASLQLTGASLAGGASCEFEATLQVPASASPGSYLNTVNDLTATIATAPATANAASDTLVINAITLTKSFSGSSAASGTPTLSFTLNNPVGGSTVSLLGFTDNLNATLSGLVATGLPKPNVCGAGSTISGTSQLTFTGGELLAGGSCTFEVSLQVPPTPISGDYLNTTSTVTASGLVVGNAATDTLVIDLVPVITPPVAVAVTATGVLTPITLVAPVVTDDRDTISPPVPVADNLGPYPLGSTFVTWTATDSAGNVAMAVQSVTVSDLGVPLVTPSPNINTEATGPTTAVTLGPVTVVDDVDTGLVATPSATGPFTVGMHIVKWSATDSSSNTGSADQLVTITDTTRPTVLLVGPATISLNVGDAYAEQGATAQDIVDLDMTAKIVTSGSVNTAVPGTYRLTYTATDTAGNSAFVERVVTVNVGTVRSFTGPLASGTVGTLSFTTADATCTFPTNPQFLPLSAASPAPPAGIVLKDGIISFVINGCTPGATVNVTLDYGKAVDPLSKYWKAGTPWFEIPATISGNSISFSLTDGGLGDTDGTANGTIVDPGGAALPAMVPVKPIPVNQPWILVLLSGLLLLGGAYAMRRRGW